MTDTPKKRYKFLRAGMKSDSGNLTWKKGVWVHEDRELDICSIGLHCSKYPDQAFSYVQGEILAVVEVKGRSIIQDNKECWSDMRIVKAYEWTKNDSIAMSILAAELVIDIFEKEYPNDDRPRKAIEAAKIYLKHPTEKNKCAAAHAAAHASVRASVRASYAAYAADAETINKIRTWMKKRIKTLKEVS